MSPQPPRLKKLFTGDNRVAEVRHEDALNFTNKLFRDFYSCYRRLLAKVIAIRRS